MFGLPASMEIFVISVVLSFLTSLVYRLLTNPKEMRETKEAVKDYSDKMKKAQKAGNSKEVEKYLNEMTGHQKRMFSKSMKPMFLSLIIFLVGFQFLGTYSDVTITLPFNLPYTTWEFPYVHFTGQYTWFWWYLIIIFPFSMVFRKLMGAV
jgi:uncharacterized membrane protein (DUF106 family)